MTQIEFLNDPNEFIGKFLVKLLLEILNEDPIQRPKFKEIREEFKKIKINDKLEYAKMLTKELENRKKELEKKNGNVNFYY